MSTADEGSDERTVIDRGVGDGDHLQRLWTPHRMNYIADAIKSGSAKSSEPFTDIPTMTDEDGLVVARGEHVYAVLNLYPYNPGHLMVVPYRRVAELESRLDETRGRLHDAQGRLHDTQGRLHDTQGRLHEAVGRQREVEVRRGRDDGRVRRTES